MAPHPVLRRQDGVDFLRGISILAVMLLHARLRLSSEGRGPDGLLPGWLEDLLFTNGDCGVIVFFAVSGFLITLTSLRRFGSLQAMQAGRFYRIRFARIAPLLLAVLAVLTGLSLGGVDGFVVESAQGGLLRAIFAVFTFHLNWLEAAHGYLPANWDVLWSLSVEEMFYLFFPLACVGLTRLRWGLLVLLLALVVMGPLARTAWTENILWRQKGYLAGMDSIALGCLTALAVGWLGGQRKIRTIWLVTLELLGGLMMMLIFAEPPWHWMHWVWRSGTGATILASGSCLVIAGSVLRGQRGGIWSAPMRWLGRHSYEVYLTHEFVVIGLAAVSLKVMRGSPMLWIATMVILSAMLGWAAARYFSEPMNRWLRGAAQPAAASSRQFSR